MNFQTGDIFFYRGKGILQLLVRLLTSLHYSIPFKDTHNHVDMAWNESENISAETNGVRLIKNSFKEEVEVYRFNNFTDDDKTTFVNTGSEYLGHEYGYSRYIIFAMKSVMFVTFIWGLFSWILSFIFGMVPFYVCLGIFIIAIVVKKIMLKLDARTEDCSELTAILLNSIGKMVYISSKPRNEFPDSIYSKIKTLELYGIVKKVAYKKTGKNEWIFD